MSGNGPDERDPKVDAAWRDLSEESPPPELDDSIRAAARRAVHAKPGGPKARAPWPAWMTFAAAASIGVVAIGVWKMMPQEIVATRPLSDVPATAQAVAPVVADAQRQSTVAATAPTSAPSQLAKAAADAVAPAISPQAPPVAAPTAAAPSAPPASNPDDTLRRPPTPAAPPTVAAVPRALQAPAAPPLGSAPPPPAVATEEPSAPPPATAGAVTARAPSPFPGAVRNAPMAAGRAEASSDAAKPAAAAGPAAAKTNANTVAAPSPEAAVAAASAPADAKSAVTDKVVRSFDDYILAIRRALDAKHDDDAVKELQALRSAYPDADERMPVDLRSWAFRIRK